jgi:hypothetical protein
VKRAPRDANGHYQLALVHEKLGDPASARRQLAVTARLDKSLAGLKETRKRLGMRRP